MKIIDDHGMIWALMNGRVQCLDGLADSSTPEEIEENGYYCDDWREALSELHDGSYINLNERSIK